MVILCIHGAPGTGKLTIGTIIQGALRNWGLMHNHLLTDLCAAITNNVDQRDILIRQYRREFLITAAENNRNVITTIAYTKNVANDVIIQELKDGIERVGGQVFFVHLNAKTEDILARLDSEIRKKYGKLTDKEIWVREDAKHDRHTPIHGSLEISTSDLSAKEAAANIIRHFSFH